MTLKNILYHLLFLMYCNTIFSQKVVTIKNPIQTGLNPYGIKDCFLIPHNDQYYLVGTDYPEPLKEKKGIQLYQSSDLTNWKPTKLLIDCKKISSKAWCKDEWIAPEIHSYKEKYYLIFSSRNNQLRPYKKLGIGIAVANTIDGEYKILTSEKPLVEGANPTLVFHNDTPFLCYDMDGRFYMASINLENAKFTSSPTEILGPSNLKNNYKYLDTPQFIKKDSLYHLTFSQFYGGYIIKIFDVVATHPMGPYSFNENQILYTWEEAEADMDIKGLYPTENYFAPPTQVVFSNQIVQLSNFTYVNVYHSSEKYSEPFLCIDPVVFDGDKIKVIDPKAKTHVLTIEK